MSQVTTQSQVTNHKPRRREVALPMQMDGQRVSGLIWGLYGKGRRVLGCVVWVKESCSGPGLCRDGAAGRFEMESYVLQSQGEGRLGRAGLEECSAGMRWWLPRRDGEACLIITLITICIIKWLLFP